jgi:hypothetical protein
MLSNVMLVMMIACGNVDVVRVLFGLVCVQKERQRKI